MIFTSPSPSRPLSVEIKCQAFIYVSPHSDTDCVQILEKFRSRMQDRGYMEEIESPPSARDSECRDMTSVMDINRMVFWWSGAMIGVIIRRQCMVAAMEEHRCENMTNLAITNWYISGFVPVEVVPVNNQLVSCRRSYYLLVIRWYLVGEDGYWWIINKYLAD
ncbi:hypothetical protein TIFTF001_020594 [Ficus carica]|uniref:Uncharacterized protein n=1 Tax=Ficus carica TaxID=3494 RepID=A0AA88AG10_FICCA|nr:hypothetical protein TIFTF001_020594 [Ficus carica]